MRILRQIFNVAFNVEGGELLWRFVLVVPDFVSFLGCEFLDRFFVNPTILVRFFNQDEV